MAFKIINRKKLYEEIVAQIVDYIQKEKLRPGDKLPSEDELTDSFKVSKTVVREALSVLAAKNIIEKKPGIGSLVKKINGATMLDQVTNKLIMGKETLKEILEFRRGMEIESAALAAERITDEELKAIIEANQQLIETNAKGGLGIEEDFLFHYLIILSSHNSIYERMFDIMSPYFLEAVKITKLQSKSLSYHYLKVAYEEHLEIIKALKEKDVHNARLCFYEHLKKNEEKLWNNHLEF